jgi:hypothetical protein
VTSSINLSALWAKIRSTKFPGSEVAIVMKEHSEEWKQLCAQAAIEQDPQKLLELTRKINELLLGKQSRLNRESSSTAEPHRD